MVPSFLVPATLVLNCRVPERGEERSGGKSSYLIQDRPGDAEFGKNAANLSNQFAGSADRRCQFQKSHQLFIRAHNETLSVVAMHVSNAHVRSGAET